MLPFYLHLAFLPIACREGTQRNCAMRQTVDRGAVSCMHAASQAGALNSSQLRLGARARGHAGWTK